MTDAPIPPAKPAHLKLIASAVEIMEEPARIGDKAFAPRLLAITTFPHQQPKDNPEAWTRRNGWPTIAAAPSTAAQRAAGCRRTPSGLWRIARRDNPERGLNYQWHSLWFSTFYEPRSAAEVDVECEHQFATGLRDR
jgi:hypothetical protein